MPTCSSCGSVARPNILMFGDAGWLSHRTNAQYDRFYSWMRSVQTNKDAKLVVIEASVNKTTILT